MSGERVQDKDRAYAVGKVDLVVDDRPDLHRVKLHSDSDVPLLCLHRPIHPRPAHL